MTKVAVVLFNLGGPDRPESVEPFLFNLFNDKAIIGAPQPMRWALAKLISKRRAPTAREIYAHLGGGSPLLSNTKRQADALEGVLNGGGEDQEYKVFIAMRYWHPFAEEAIEEVRNWQADEVVLLPLYPQFSTTTSGSSIADWKIKAGRAGFRGEARVVCCYPMADGFLDSVTSRIEEVLEKVERHVRVLFSAHGLPKKIIAKGDPYQWQVEQSSAGVVERLGRPDLDWNVCYQSRVGPLEWIGPATEDEIAKAGAEGKSLILVPIAFVSEHSETLVELDIEYRDLAKEKGVPSYHRVATVDDSSAFISGLAQLTKKALAGEAYLSCDTRTRCCPAEWTHCPMRQ